MYTVLNVAKTVLPVYDKLYEFVSINFKLPLNFVFSDTEDASETDVAKQETQYTEIKEQLVCSSTFY